MTPITDQELEAQLRRPPPASLRPEVHARMRASVLAEFQRVTNSPADRYNQQNHGLFAFINYYFTRPMIPVLIAIVLFVSAAGTAVAADRAKPGDALYSVDRGLEVAKFAVVFGKDAKTKYLEQLAEERGKEFSELEQEGDTQHADEAHQHVLNALERVQVRLEHNGASDKARSTIEERLNALRDRLGIDEEVGNPAGLTEAEATVHGQTTTVQYEFNDQKSTITLQTTDVDAVVTSLADLLNIDEAAVRAVLRVETTGDNSGPGSDDQGENANGNVNGDNEDTQSGLTEAEAKIHGPTTTVQLEFNDQKSVLTLQTTDVNVIVQAIVSNLGIDEATVRAALKIEYEDEPADNQGDDTSGNSNENLNTNSGDQGDEDQNDNENSNGSQNANTNSGDNDEGDDNQNVNENRNTNSGDDERVNENRNDNEDNSGRGNDNQNDNSQDDPEDSEDNPY